MSAPQNYFRSPLSRFIIEFSQKTKPNDVRIGQFTYNEFMNAFPGIYIPEDADCFFDDNLLEAFWSWVMTMDDYINSNYS